MLTEFWAYHYDDLKRSGRQEEEFEDEDFNLDEALAKEGIDPAEWVDVIKDGEAGE